MPGCVFLVHLTAKATQKRFEEREGSGRILQRWSCESQQVVSLASIKEDKGKRTGLKLDLDEADNHQEAKKTALAGKLSSGPESGSRAEWSRCFTRGHLRFDPWHHLKLTSALLGANPQQLGGEKPSNTAGCGPKPKGKKQQRK